MKVVGFSFSKLAAERIAQTPIKNPPEVLIDFLNFEKEPSSMFKDAEIAKVSFSYKLLYQETHDAKKSISLGNVTIEGFILISLDKTEFKEIEKGWKKKEIPSDTKFALFNIILRRCTPKAIMLEDETNLPFHVPMPRIQKK